MKPEPWKCPVKHLIQPVEPSRCPFGRLYNWFLGRIAHITKTVPYRVAEKERDELVRVSSIYASLLVKHKAGVIQEVRDRLAQQGQEMINVCKPGSSRDDILWDIFFDAQDMKHAKDFETIAKSEEPFRRAQVLYHTGVENIGKIWIRVLQKYRETYRRFPTPEELTSFRPFVVYFATKLWESPSFLANAIMTGIKQVDGWKAVKIGKDGMVQISGKALQVAQRKATITFNTTTNIHGFIENGYCPALSMIPKITEMCCEAFEAGYTDVYSLHYE